MTGGEMAYRRWCIALEKATRARAEYVHPPQVYAFLPEVHRAAWEALADSYSPDPDDRDARYLTPDELEDSLDLYHEGASTSGLIDEERARLRELELEEKRREDGDQGSTHREARDRLRHGLGSLKQAIDHMLVADDQTGGRG